MTLRQLLSRLFLQQGGIDLLVLVFIFLFLLSFFEPQYLFSLTTTTGGDTCSHYPTAVYLKNVLLPQGKIMGWDPGNYAGYPLFYHYFPLTFLLMAGISCILPLQIAFKLVSVLGVFLLPVAAYFALRFLKYPFPVPSLAAIFSLVFLFMEANSMWGGNIPSTLAGEYSYALSLALLIIFFGSLYAGVEDKKRIVFNAGVLFLIGLSHAFTLVFSGVIAVFFLFTRKDFIKNFFYLFKVFGLAGLLLSFWLVPFIANVPYVTSYVTRWQIASLLEVLPLIILPFILLGAISFFLNLFDRRTLYFGYVVSACGILYFLAPYIGMLDIRFIPFIQLFTVLLGATFIYLFLGKVKLPQIVPGIALLVVILWILPNVHYIKGWIKWNYEGFEKKGSWPLFCQINQHLAKTKEGRVVYEHSPLHNIFGSERAFENLPYFARRDTLEGLYMQSSISSPFVFYIQSEISKVCSGPFPQYTYTGLNLPAAIPHLKLFNVTQYIVRSPEAKEQAKATPALKKEVQFGDYEIYRLLGNDGHYVVPLQYEPVLFSTQNWKQDFHAWFKRLELLDIPLVYVKNPTTKDREVFNLRADNILHLPKVPLRIKLPSVEETLGNESITFTTNLVGYPHMLKVSYHPNWKVEGADKIYLVSPSFMLVYPKQPTVRLYFGKSVFNYVGEALSLIGLLIVLLSLVYNSLTRHLQ